MMLSILMKAAAEGLWMTRGSSINYRDFVSDQDNMKYNQGSATKLVVGCRNSNSTVHA